MKMLSVSSFLSLWLLTFGCASLSSTPKVTTSCSFDEAWSVSLASVDEFELRRIDKPKGIIETEWIAIDSKKTSGFITFQRDVNAERARFFLNLSQHPIGAEISILQAREFFSPMGVQSQSNKWRRIPPIAEEEQRLAQRISTKLKAMGCTIQS
jgi:hypothetical protein